jgi:hypothetical protein
VADFLASVCAPIFYENLLNSKLANLNLHQMTTDSFALLDYKALLSIGFGSRALAFSSCVHTSSAHTALERFAAKWVSLE